jgi:predicted NUDIX family NTP pyrophosphohydrolase
VREWREAFAIARLSSGLLLFRWREARPEVLLVHMGGPFWRRRDAGAWSLPKGEHGPSEDSLLAARREFAEELGMAPPSGAAIDLGSLKQPSGKIVRAWAQEADIDVGEIRSNTFELEWPRGSGCLQRFPEVDRAGWFELAAAREKLIGGQLPFLDLLLERAGRGAP